jgi:hypothetical protein
MGGRGEIVGGQPEMAVPRGTPTRVFCEKRLQTIENKELCPQKREKEKKRVCKLLKTQNEPMRAKSANREGTEVGARRSQRVTPPGFCMDVNIRGLRGKGL